MKQLLSLVCAFALSMMVLTGCAAASSSSSELEEVAPESTASETASVAKTAFRIASLRGPTTMGLVQLMNEVDSAAARHDYQVTMYGTADEIAPPLIKGELDVALVPCNLASVLYNKTEGAVQVAAINTLGVLYMLETGDTIQSVEDLRGKTVYTTGMGTTPEYVLNYILTQNGLVPGEDVTIEFKSEATEVLAAMQATDDIAIAMLPQPYATAVQMQMDTVRVALDMTEEWNKVAGSNQVTGVVLVRKAFAEENPEAFAQFMQDYAASVEWVNANTDEAAALVVGYEIVAKEPIAKRALPACNIAFITGEAMQTDVSAYLQVLFEANPASVGGALPNEDFYYHGA